MSRYIAFLRAVNVGGRFVTMERLRALFNELGFENVGSYIQSGNLFFDSAETDRADMQQRIERCLEDALGFAVPVMLRTTEEVGMTLGLDPFKDVTADEHTRLYVAFISKPLPDSLVFPYLSATGEYEVVAATSGEAFVVMRQRPGRPGNAGAFLEKSFGLQATIRFYATTVKILQAACI